MFLVDLRTDFGKALPKARIFSFYSESTFRISPKMTSISSSLFASDAGGHWMASKSVVLGFCEPPQRV